MAATHRHSEAGRIIKKASSSVDDKGRIVIRQPASLSGSRRAHDITIEIDGKDLSPFKRALIQKISSALVATPDDELRGSAQESAEQVARRFIATKRVENEWDEAIGPFYETKTLVHWLNKNHRMNVQHQIDRKQVLAVKSGRTLLYPTFQFDRSGQPLPGLPRVLEVLEQYLTDPWDQALWLNSPIDGEPDGETAATFLRAGRADDVVRMAQEDVARWAQ